MTRVLHVRELVPQNHPGQDEPGPGMLQVVVEFTKARVTKAFFDAGRGTEDESAGLRRCSIASRTPHRGRGKSSLIVGSRFRSKLWLREGERESFIATQQALVVHKLQRTS